MEVEEKGLSNFSVFLTAYPCLIDHEWHKKGNTVSDVAQQVWEGIWLEGELTIQRPDEGDETQEESSGRPIVRLQDERPDRRSTQSQWQSCILFDLFLFGPKIFQFITACLSNCLISMLLKQWGHLMENHHMRDCPTI